MLTRRELLRSGGLAGIAGLAGAPAAQAQTPAGERLPPSIAALTSMREQARPITHAERLARLEKARRLMAASKLDAILLTGGTSLTYFTGLRFGNSERLMALVVPAKGDPFVVCPAFEVDRLNEQIRQSPLQHVDIRSWHEDESPFQRVGQTLRERGLSTGRLGIEETAKFVFADSIAKANPSLTVVSATPVTAGCRMIKDAHELELLRLACRATLACYKALHGALEPGMTENTARSLVAAGYARLGFRGSVSVQVDTYTALPHGSEQPQTLRPNSIVMVDDGCVVEGYQSDLTRTFVIGSATDKMKRVFDIVAKAQQAALAAARPGATLASVDAAARKVIIDAGYGPGFTYFTHRLGHGLGMDMHEWPYLVDHNMYGWDTPVLQPGMVFSNEPGIYIPGEFGIRLEDDMVITEHGAELLTPPSTSIEHPFAS
ncbi:MAG: Xaa-Pro peptidase family protein [Vicinamibacterales bacterium]